MSLGNKNAKNCYTCRYWTGCSVRIKDKTFVDYDQAELAVCNLTGHKKKAWGHCGDHEKRLDF